MAKRRSSISKANSYQELGEFWDTHDTTDFHEQTYEVKPEVNGRQGKTYVPLEKNLSRQIRALAKERGISPETLVNLWIQEKLQKEAA